MTDPVTKTEALALFSFETFGLWSETAKIVADMRQHLMGEGGRRPECLALAKVSENLHRLMELAHRDGATQGGVKVARLDPIEEPEAPDAFAEWTARCRREARDPAHFATLARFTSPGVPEGFDTVLGHFARTNPEALEVLGDDYVGGTQRDGFWLRARCRERYVEPVKVEAPAALQEQGIERVNAYPLDLLKRRFGDC